MNINRNVSFGSGIGPSGHEVESAMFTPEVGRDELPSGGRASVMRRLDDLKSRSLSRVHDVRRVMSDRTSIIKSSARTGVTSGLTKVQSSMRNSPAKWAGIAAGSGLILGMLGRFIQSRNEQRRHMPQLVVIETSC
jgi:ElaB/YqjD/DUF883 family membrane-anchored ribosome-binding protein